MGEIKRCKGIQCVSSVSSGLYVVPAREFGSFDWWLLISPLFFVFPEAVYVPLEPLDMYSQSVSPFTSTGLERSDASRDSGGIALPSLSADGQGRRGAGTQYDGSRGCEHRGE